MPVMIIENLTFLCLYMQSSSYKEPYSDNIFHSSPFLITSVIALVHSFLLSLSVLQNCRSTEKNAVATCFSMECASYNINRPIRYCSQCNNIRHNNRRGTDHIVHTTIGSPWGMEPQMQNFTIEAIVRQVNSPHCFLHVFPWLLDTSFTLHDDFIQQKTEQPNLNSELVLRISPS